MDYREAAVQAVKDHPSTTFMAPYESLAEAVLKAAVPLIRDEVRREILTDDERAMLRCALALAEDRMSSRSDEFTAEEQAALESLKRLAGPEPTGNGS